MLNVVELQTGTEPTIAFLHGFTQTAEVWRSIALHLGLPNHMVAVDLPGHGLSDPDHDKANLTTAAELVVEAVGVPALFVGYSLGARVLLEVMAHHRDAAIGVAMVGAKLPVSGPFKRMQRKAEDEKLAVLIEQHGTEEFVDEWLKQPFNAVIPAERQFRDLRIANRKEGLAASLRHCGSAEQQTSVASLRVFKAPVLVLEGDRELPQVRIDNQRLGQLIPTAQVIEIAGTGHSLPFEEPAAFAPPLREFMESFN